MKKLKLLTTPMRLSKVTLDDLEYDAGPLKEGKVARLRLRQWRRLRRQTSSEMQ
ncbi:MAG TPA: hypothetical protein VGS08_03400 [Candidatus Saccharimonadales bacterium]|nr:hypothetical protein [Candidatus Saccharimonadales bacterium]